MTMVKRLQHTKADSAPRPGSISAQSGAQDQTTAPADSPSPRYHFAHPSLRPPPLPQSTNTPQALYSRATTPHTAHPSTYTPRGNSPSPCTLRGPKTNQRTKVKPQ